MDRQWIVRGVLLSCAHVYLGLYKGGDGHIYRTAYNRIYRIFTSEIPQCHSDGVITSPSSCVYHAVTPSSSVGLYSTPRIRSHPHIVRS